MAEPHSPEAWQDWVQERGLYFLGERTRSTWTSCTRDPFPFNKGPKRGALVEAQVGKGRGCMSAWAVAQLRRHRGAYQLLANLVSAGKARALRRQPQVTAGFDVIVVGEDRPVRRGPQPGARRRPRAHPRSRRVSPAQTLWRRPHVARAEALSGVEAALPRISTHIVQRLYMEAPGGESATVDTAAPAVLLVRRVEFDHLLMELARGAGAEVAEGADITRASEHVSGVRLEAATGACSRRRSWWPPTACTAPSPGGSASIQAGRATASPST